MHAPMHSADCSPHKLMRCEATSHSAGRMTLESWEARSALATPGDDGACGSS